MELNLAKYDDKLTNRVHADFVEFLSEFNDTGTNQPRYRNDIKELFKSERNTLTVNYGDIYDFNSTLGNCIQSGYFRFYSTLCRALHAVALEFCDDDISRLILAKKELYVSFYNAASKLRLRELSSRLIGSLLCISGQVVRAHPVYPELCKGSFACDLCGALTKGIEQQFRYTQPVRCSNPQCHNRTKFTLDVQESTFIDFQKIRIQEAQGEIPRGSLPLSMDVIIRGELVETVQPGDRCDFIGTLIVIPDVSQLSAPGMRAEVNTKNRSKFAADREGVIGLKALGVRDLSYRLAFLACNLCASGSRYSKKLGDLGEADPQVLWDTLTREERREMQKMSHDKNILTNLTNSLFPEIYGSNEVKLGVLLMLFGGVSKSCGSEGTNLRGDINVCLVGDPSTAKSQILKTVEHFSPRAVYTSGKASSAAGLTAAVVKDEDSFEFVIEAGALMLADNGVCCIDEFDKMDPRDQVAIHEAMEQQTISITKAGIKATLNARASILAAANPVGGRYDKSRPLRHNVQLSAPIMSRFDLFFVLIDQCNRVTDYAIARRIVDNHVTKTSGRSFKTIYSYDQIQKYITFSRCFKPKLSKETMSTLVSEYKKLRMNDSNNSMTSSWRITVRQLESLIRLSEALARIQCFATVERDHVLEASHLLSNSLIRVDQPDIALQDNMEDTDAEMLAEKPSRNVLKVRNITIGSPKADESGGVKKGETPFSQVDAHSIKMKFVMYKKIADMLVLHIREVEDERASDDDWQGVKQSELTDWYLNMMEDTMDTVEELEVQTDIVKRVIKRLLTEDNILIQLNSEVEGDPFLVVHPNYVVSD